MKKKILPVCGCLLAATIFTGCGGSSAGENGEVNVYNWGEYIDEDVIGMFEEETGIKVTCIPSSPTAPPTGMWSVRLNI